MTRPRKQSSAKERRQYDGADVGHPNMTSRILAVLNRNCRIFLRDDGKYNKNVNSLLCTVLLSFEIFVVERRGIIIAFLLFYGCALETAGANVENIHDGLSE